MIHVPLSLRLVPQNLRPPTGWLLPGSDPAAWLAHLAEAFPDPAAVDFYLVPRSRQDRSPVALFAIPAEPLKCHPTRHFTPYGRIGNLYLPTDAILWPPVTDPELAALLHFDVNIFHPAIGLVGFSQADRVRLPQLLQPPSRRTTNWSLARPGLPPPARLVAVLPLHLPRSQDILDQGRDDIGQEPLNDVPPPPSEPRTHPIVKAATTAPLAAAAMLLQKLADKLQGKKPEPKPNEKPPAQPPAKTGAQSPAAAATPSGPGITGWLSNLAANAAKALSDLTPRQFANLAAAMEQRRDKELHRLLALLQSNPDEGLRYALPLAGTPARGLTTPSDRLTPRNPNFDLSHTYASRPADPWVLSYQMQEQLRANYRRLATRELQLGRHRRAAYIFAQLLGDLSSAANALKQGHHFREAAVLYRDRLGQKKTAADCLCEGGLILEAIPLYEELGLFEHAGDLYTQLAQPDQAAPCYRKAVGQLVAADDHFKAAALLENKLNVPREALALLDSAWPNKPQAAACLEESFALLARLKDFPEAQSRIARHRGRTYPSHVVPRLVHVLTQVATTFPEDATRHLASDATKVVIGQRLALMGQGHLNITPAEARTLTQFLPQLAPADRLLPRDTQRYNQRLTPQPSKSAPIPTRTVQLGTAPQRKTLATPKVLRSFKLPEGYTFDTFVSAEYVFYAVGAVGVPNGWACILQSDWVGHPQGPRLITVAGKSPHAAVYCQTPPQLWAMQFPNQPLTNAPGFRKMEYAPAVELAMPWLPENALAIACDHQHHAWVLHNEVADSLEMVLSVYDAAANRLIATHTVDSVLPLGTVLQLPIPLIVRSNYVYIALGNRILTFAYARTWGTTTLPQRVTHMVASHALVRMRVAVGMEIGGVVFTDGLDSFPIAEGLDFPILAFSRGGTLLAVAKSEIRLYRMSGKRPEYRGSWPGHNFDASTPGGAVLPTDRLDEIALISPDGTVQILALEGF